MKLLLRFIDWFLHTSLFTACCATALCMATEQLITAAPSVLFTRLHVLVFGSTLLVYNTPRIVKRSYGRERGAQRFRQWYFFFFFVGMAMAGAALLGMPVKVWVCCGLLSVFAFGYFLPLLPFKDKKRLRDFGWVKIAVLAGVWTVATSILPMLYNNKHVAGYPVEVLVRFLFIFALCIIFDIRDVQADLANNISTLPHKVGVKNSYRLINVTLLLFVVLSVVQYLRFPVTERLVGAVLTAAVTAGVVSFLRRHPSERGYMGLADGVMLFYALVVLL